MLESTHRPIHILAYHTVQNIRMMQAGAQILVSEHFSGRPILHGIEWVTEVAIVWGEVKGYCYNLPVFSTDLIFLIHAKDWDKGHELCFSSSPPAYQTPGSPF